MNCWYLLPSPKHRTRSTRCTREVEKDLEQMKRSSVAKRSPNACAWCVRHNPVMLLVSMVLKSGSFLVATLQSIICQVRVPYDYDDSLASPSWMENIPRSLLQLVALLLKGMVSLYTYGCTKPPTKTWHGRIAWRPTPSCRVGVLESKSGGFHYVSLVSFGAPLNDSMILFSITL